MQTTDAVERDTMKHMSQQEAAEALARAREKAADCVDPIAALERLRDNDYTTYLELHDAYVRKDAARQHEIEQEAFETEINLFIENEPSLLREFRRSRLADEVRNA